MVKSKGYFAGKDTKFPAVSLDIEEIRIAYKNIAKVKLFAVSHSGAEAARKGYEGMVLVIGRRIK